MDWIRIVIAAVLVYALGAIWYGPLFGKVWMKLTGMTMKDMEKSKGKMPLLYTGGFVTAFVMALVVSYLFSIIAPANIFAGMYIGFWFWLGFIATVSFGGVLWQNQPMKLWVLNNAYSLLQLLLIGAVLTF